MTPEKPSMTKHLVRACAAVVLTVFLTAGISQPAEALKWSRKLGWTGTKLDEQVAKDWQPMQWDEKHHHPLAWRGGDWDLDNYEMQDRWGRAALIDRMYATGILKRQYARKHVATLEVGETFFRLSEQDKHRFMKVVADHYGILESRYGWFEIREYRSHVLVGHYTVDGLLLM